MGKQQYGRKSGFKRGKSHKNNTTSRGATKSQRTKDEIYSKPAQDTSDISDEEELSEERSTVASEEEVEEMEDTVYKEPSEYDTLLRKLGSGNESVANAYRRRLREEEGKSDTDDDTDDGSEEPEEDDDDVDEGTDTDSHKSPVKRNKSQGSSLGDAAEKNAETHISDDEASETDEDGDLTVNCQLAPGPEESTSSFSTHLDHKLSKVEIDYLEQRKWKYKWEAPAFGMPHCKWMGTGDCFMKGTQPNLSHDIKKGLYNHWLDTYKASGGNDFESSKQKHFLSLCNSYRDILHHSKKPFYLKGLEEDSSVMDAYLMHSLNHIFRTRDLVTKNEAKLAKNQNNAAEIVNEGLFLDHGFTRPKVLIILPLASIALRVVKRLIQLTPSKHKVNVEHLDRFCDEFGTGVADTGDDEGNDIIDSKLQKPSKPSDFEALFGGNNLDHFMVGIKFTRRSIRLYGDFYSSDMIVASPLGLITKIGEAEVDKEKDLDYLSSIEVLVIDHADVIAMQNWSHVNTVVEQMNKIPSKQHGTDIMRIRPWYFDGHAQFYRQTMILGNYLNPDISALFNRHCINYKGKVKLACDHKGVLSRVVLQVRQIYERFDTQSIVDVDDARLEHFAKKVFPKIKDSIQGGVMLFVSSYFEFVRVRNFLKSQEASLCLLGEYTNQADISRARLWFFQGKRKIMLYTERAHFYHRYKIRGIQNLIIYSLPERKEFYPEIVNMLEGSHNMTCTTLFSRFDQLRLERIVGTAPAKRMGASDKNIFVFC